MFFMSYLNRDFVRYEFSIYISKLNDFTVFQLFLFFTIVRYQNYLETKKVYINYNVIYRKTIQTQNIAH